MADWNNATEREKRIHREGADSLFENTYLCTISKENWDKVWENGTISKDDFIPVMDDETVREDMARRLHRMQKDTER